MTKSNYTADWRGGVSALQEKTDNRELLRYLRICEKWLDACFDLDDYSIVNMELEFRSFLAKQRRDNGQALSASYINNLMWCFRKIIDESPKKQFFHESSEAWRQVFIQNNESASVLPSPRAKELFLAFIMTVGWEVKPLSFDELAQFKAYLVTKDFDPFEGAHNFTKQIRCHLRKRELYVEPEAQTFSVPTELTSVFDDMKALALKGHKSTTKKKTLRQAMQEDDLQPILEKTWKKVSRDFIRYVHFLVDNKFIKLTNVDWSKAFATDVVTDYLDHRNQLGDGITKNTAETLLASISKCMVLLEKTEHLTLNSQDMSTMKRNLWSLNPKLVEVFDKKGVLDKLSEGPGLPLYEGLYPQFMEYFKRESAKILKLKAQGVDTFRKQRDLLTFILEVEYGWRPNDLVQTLTVDCISAHQSRDGRDFFFISYIPSKTAWRTKAPKASAPLAPWYYSFFKTYLEELEKRGLKHLIPTTSSPSANRRMSTRITKLSYKLFKQKLGSTSYRRIHASFFQRHSLPGLYLFTGRTAKDNLSLQTEIELKVYAPGATTPEALLEARYGRRVKDILGIE
ncbi:hypothetical protein [Bdellovibrio sp. NC01]|uniref:hypothetical protein n=1 Tax=Bdellovibrio sp. NC01 TaxID=2220073 RepID=UPI001158DFA9|nr:hypothetical protein [Bdellovibrio sp. NC01]QDK36403.1 hypothetical protein DOE51_01700 [Bdellovibrio sp. NC01]